jgi:hypothetical protein
LEADEKRKKDEASKLLIQRTTRSKMKTTFKEEVEKLS